MAEIDMAVARNKAKTVRRRGSTRRSDGNQKPRARPLAKGTSSPPTAIPIAVLALRLIEGEVGFEAGDDQQEHHPDESDDLEEIALDRRLGNGPSGDAPAPRRPSTEGPSSTPAMISPTTEGWFSRWQISPNPRATARRIPTWIRRWSTSLCEAAMNGSVIASPSRFVARLPSRTGGSCAISNASRRSKTTPVLARNLHRVEALDRVESPTTRPGDRPPAVRAIARRSPMPSWRCPGPLDRPRRGSCPRLDQGQQDGLAADQTAGRLEVGQHPVGVDHQSLDQGRESGEHVIEGEAGVGQDHPLGRGVADVALVPQCDVLEADLGVAPRSRAMPVIRSETIGLRLWGMAEEPFCPARKGSRTSPTSDRWRWRISVAILSSDAPVRAMAERNSAWRSRAVTWVEAGSG